MITELTCFVKHRFIKIIIPRPENIVFFINYCIWVSVFYIKKLSSYP